MYITSVTKLAFIHSNYKSPSKLSEARCLWVDVFDYDIYILSRLRLLYSSYILGAEIFLGEGEKG